MKKPAILFFHVLLVLFLAACSDDSENPTQDPGIGDPDIEEPIDENPDEEENPGDEVVTIPGVSVPGSTAKAGNLPASTGDLHLPQGVSNIYTIKEKKLRVYAPANPDEVVGFYLKIEGTDYYYYDISGGGASSGRKAASQGRITPAIGRQSSPNERIATTSEEEEEAYFIIDLSSELGQDTLCVSYSYYNSSGSISNSVSKCMVLVETGGANSSFLTANAWTVLSGKDYLGDELVDEYEITDYFSVEEFTCESGATVIVEYHLIQENTLTFLNNGQGSFHSNFTYTEIDFEATYEKCEPVFDLINEIEEGGFAWSYEDETGRLALVFINENDEVEYSELSSIETQGDHLVMTIYYEEIEYSFDDDGDEYAYNKTVLILTPKE